ncbi:Putative Peroxidase 48 [Morus notabilis]|uniref:Peroxidase n=1 Tax=Morus notabilis TaxID=981085 RepID=W9QSF6_9ROSA|nr:putative Peroxidase 48 [Morus notabilis]EXB53348.1 Putative Peroxidase 48 [Morus notabilis]
MLLKKVNGMIILAISIFAVLITFSNPRIDPQKFFVSLSSSSSGEDCLVYSQSPSFVSLASVQDSFSFNSVRTGLDYDFYRSSCPDAEKIVGSTMAQIYSQHKDVSPALLRLFFHDCFVHGCDASILLDDSFGDKNYSAEKDAVPNRTLKSLDKIDHIKGELERVCPGVVSCADIISLATRDGIVLAGGPFYPVFTGRRDSIRSYHDEALAEIPKPDDDLTQILHLFALKGFNERETVSLLGGHNIGKMSCEFIHNRLYNFNGTGQPDPTLAPNFLNEMRLRCREDNGTLSRNGLFERMHSRGSGESASGRPSIEELSSSVPSGADFDTHYYQRLLMGRGLLFADQQLMAAKKTEGLVRAYASDDGSTFRIDFAGAMMKMSNLNVLTGTQGRVRLNCSLPLFSAK